MPPNNQSTNPFDRQSSIEGIKHIIAVASGKGGVGKSTISANLAVALALEGKKVGLLDCDIYGPSVPRLFGALNLKPEVNSQGKIEPLVRAGVKLMSIGFLVEESAAVIWRGPMLFKAIDQFLKDVNWGELDVLVVDLPPGTGDVQLTLAQKVPLSGVVMVCTPQNLALSDVKKAVDMFQRINIPLIGLVENMAYLQHGDQKIDLFPKGDLRAFLDSKQIPKLSEIPFYPAVAKASEVGIPLTQSEQNSEAAKLFKNLAKEVSSQIGI
jgi:ATP-binding protein involved in chromosome partitioning